jgi:hypothetical protein
MSEMLADELHAFIAAAPHKYPGHLIELFDRAEKALRRCSADSAEYQRCMDMLGDVPGPTLEDRLTRYIGCYMALQIKAGAQPQTAPIGYVSQATLRLLSERGQAGHICPVPAYDTLIPVYAGPAQQSQADNSPQAAPELTATCQKLLPGGIIDDATYAEIEDALDRADAPATVGGRWLKLHERIAALTAERPAASAEPQSQAESAQKGSK